MVILFFELIEIDGHADVGGVLGAFDGVDVEVGNGGFLAGFEADRSYDSAARQLWAKIPAELALSFSEVDAVRVCEIGEVKGGVLFH